MITSGLRKSGEYSTGETLGSDVTSDGLAVMNTMLESWSLERLMCYQITQESLALTASDGTYTIGTGGDFNTDRPTKIVDPCFIRDSSNLDSPLQIIDAAAYGRIVQKTIDGTYPGYRRAIEFNFAVEMASEFGRDPPPSVVSVAKSAKATLKSLNMPDSMMRLDSGIAGGGIPNILTGP